MIVNYCKLRVRILLSATLFLSFTVTGHSKENSNVKPTPAEPADFEKNTALYGSSVASVKVNQFFANGKPNVQETVEGTLNGGSVAGMIWDGSGKATKYRR